MRKDIEVGDYVLALDTLPTSPPADGQSDASAEGYAVRVRVARLDGRPLHGTTLVTDSGEMSGDHGPFATVAEAMAHGEAWGRHYVSRILEHGL
ncbi:hypothetical protein [Caballeronia sp. M1242]|uniref:hypothetical protein n=1 Tax=Caballeronia sp. M1242 TaxID=2814653 RepID=UPI0019D1D854|nr:hypothetical protein [Caballeronia sp. M1242]QSN62146.1 hypothetical protein JYK05_04460 [Caballeronia sp. M1242]